MRGHTKKISCLSDPALFYLNKTIQITLLISRNQDILGCFLFYFRSIFSYFSFNI